MTVRQRSRFLQSTQGSKKLYLNNVLQSESASLFTLLNEQCSDTADLPGIDHNLSISTYSAIRGPGGIETINGVRTTGSNAGSGYFDYLPSYYHSKDTHLSIPDTSISGNDSLAVVARTNPSRPLVTPLTLIQDVVDIPRMLKDAGRLMKKGAKNLTVKDLANQNLATQFGWLPLVDDVHKLLDFQTHTHRRVAELNRLYSAQGLKRRIQLGTWNAESTSLNETVVSGLYGALRVNLQKSSYYTKWGTCRWKPTSVPLYQPGTEAQIWQVRRILSGITPEGLTQGVWDVIPWTWLLDWFSNVGDFMSQHSNSVPAEVYHVNVMLKKVTVNRFSRASGDTWVQGGEGVASFTTKLRDAGTPTLSASLPFIGLRRLSILGSLFIQRFK